MRHADEPLTVEQVAQHYRVADEPDSIPNRDVRLSPHSMSMKNSERPRTPRIFVLGFGDLFGCGTLGLGTVDLLDEKLPSGDPLYAFRISGEFKRGVAVNVGSTLFDVLVIPTLSGLFG